MKKKIISLISFFMVCMMLCSMPVFAAESTNITEKSNTLRTTSKATYFQLTKVSGYYGQGRISNVGSNPTIRFQASGNSDMEVDVYVTNSVGGKYYFGRCRCNDTVYAKKFNFLATGEGAIEAYRVSGSSSGATIYCMAWAVY